MDRPLAVIIMAAGKGTRMKNPEMAKVMYPINGRPMIEYVVDLARGLHSLITVVIVGWQKESVIDHLQSVKKDVTFVEQSPQLGTGHAVMQAEAPLKMFDGDVLVLSGDVPLLSFETVRALLECHRQQSAAATVLTCMLADASGYGRVVRAPDGSVTTIVEQRDATEEQLTIREVNSGIYVFDKAKLFEALRWITPTNAQKEYYLTDVFQYFWKNKIRVSAIAARDSQEVQGINTVQQLDEIRSKMQKIEPPGS